MQDNNNAEDGASGVAEEPKEKAAWEEMDMAIESLDKKALPMPTSDKQSIREEFKGHFYSKARSPNLDLLFSALKTIQPTSTEAGFNILSNLKLQKDRGATDKVNIHDTSFASPLSF